MVLDSTKLYSLIELSVAVEKNHGRGVFHVLRQREVGGIHFGLSAKDRGKCFGVLLRIMVGSHHGKILRMAGGCF